MRDRSSELLQKTRSYDRQNFAIAKDVLREPEKYPHLAEWAALVVRRLEGSNSLKVQQELFKAA